MIMMDDVLNSGAFGSPTDKTVSLLGIVYSDHILF